MKIFVDSDVVISSLLSSKGAAFLLLNQNIKLSLYISNFSVQELVEVAERLQVEKKELQKLIKKRLLITKLKKTKDMKKTFAQYVFDEDDAHVVAGAKQAHVRFLITYNIKDFKSERIKRDLGITILTPGQLLQYLRSLK